MYVSGAIQLHARHQRVADGHARRHVCAPDEASLFHRALACLKPLSNRSRSATAHDD